MWGWTLRVLFRWSNSSTDYLVMCTAICILCHLQVILKTISVSNTDDRVWNCIGLCLHIERHIWATEGEFCCSLLLLRFMKSALELSFESLPFGSSALTPQSICSIFWTGGPPASHHCLTSCHFLCQNYSVQGIFEGNRAIKNCRLFKRVWLYNVNRPLSRYPSPVLHACVT